MRMVNYADAPHCLYLVKSGLSVVVEFVILVGVRMKRVLASVGRRGSRESTATKNRKREKVKTSIISALGAIAFTVCGTAANLPDKISCEGGYGGHLQGVATDGESIYWSFTVSVVKTDLTGKVLISRQAPSHQGDLCYKDGVVYVAVNRGQFNTEKKGGSQVTAYDAKTLEPIKTTMLPEIPHGAGGMTWKGDHFFIIGGLPLKHENNYVYEYTSDFTFVKRHDLDTGFT